MGKLNRIKVLVGLLAVGSACAPVTVEPPLAEESDDVPSTALTFDDEFFSSESTVNLEFTVSAASQRSLLDDGTSWVPADLKVRVGDREQTLSRIGMRLKGNSSRRTFDQKAAFNLRFDRYDSKQTLGGVKRVALNNMVQDPSMLREFVAYSLFREAGLPTQRFSYARVVVNGELFGLYLLIESAENTVALDRWFSDIEGTLYENAYGGDLVLGALGAVEHKTGPDENLRALTAFVEHLDELQAGGAEFLDVADQFTSSRHVLDFMAAETVLGHWDGATFGRNNSYLYLRSDGRVSFIPWGLDQVFQRPQDPFREPVFRLAAWCNESPACRVRLGNAVQNMLQVAQNMDMSGLARRIDQRIATDRANDPRQEHTLERVVSSRAEVFDFIDAQMRHVATVLECVDPSASRDFDGDGVPGCGLDCDDDDPTRHPGHDELCNLRDDDCDEEIDEDPSCDRCIAVWADSAERVDFCFQRLTRDDAASDCISRGGHLATIVSAEQAATIADASAFAFATISRWIGATDRDDEDVFVWADGAPVTFTYWNPGEPNNDKDEDCVSSVPWVGGRWNDVRCDELLPYYCSIPVSH